MSILISGCGTASSCGAPYTFNVDGKTIYSGDCAGTFIGGPSTMIITHGQNFALRITAQSTAHGLSPAYPVPQPSNPTVALKSIHGINVRYQAQARGHVQLQVRSEYCPSDPKIGTCSVLDITVR